MVHYGSSAGPKKRGPHAITTSKYKVIRKSIRDIRLLWYSSQDGHTKWKNVKRGRDTPSFCPNLQMLDKSTLGDVVDVNPVIKFLPHTHCNIWQSTAATASSILWCTCSKLCKMGAHTIVDIVPLENIRQEGKRLCEKCAQSTNREDY